MTQAAQRQGSYSGRNTEFSRVKPQWAEHNAQVLHVYFVTLRIREDGSFSMNILSNSLLLISTNNLASCDGFQLGINQVFPFSVA